MDALIRLRNAQVCTSEEAGQLIRSAGSMTATYAYLLEDPHVEDRAIVTRLLEYEIKEHELHQGLSENMLVCVYLLAQHRYVEDCLPIGRAKMANFSTFLGLPCVLLVAAGIDATKSFLQEQIHRTAASTAEAVTVSQPSQGSKLPETLLQCIRDGEHKRFLRNPEGQLLKLRRSCEKSFGVKSAPLRFPTLHSLPQKFRSYFSKRP